MRNKLPDLNDHLFAQLERLSNEDLSGDDLKEEIGRAKALSSIAKDITNNAELMLEAAKFRNDFRNAEIPEQLCITQKK